MNRNRRTLVALSGTETDRNLVRYANALAGHGFAAHYDFLHVRRDGHSPGPEYSDPQVLALCERLVAAEFNPPRPDVTSRCHLRVGVRIDAILDFVAREQSDLILLGHKRNSASRRSLAQRLALVGPASIWMVPEGAPLTIERIVAPVDFSTNAADSFAVAAAIAHGARRPSLTALHVYADGSLANDPVRAEQFRKQEQQKLEQFLLPLDKHGVSVDPRLLEGNNVAGSILYFAEQARADLLVMNTRGRSNAAAILLGSVTSQVMIESNIAVLAVKHFGAKQDLFDVLRSNQLWNRSNPKTN